jgi:hypothetical protein
MRQSKKDKASRQAKLQKLLLKGQKLKRQIAQKDYEEEQEEDNDLDIPELDEL